MVSECNFVCVLCEGLVVEFCELKKTELCFFSMVLSKGRSVARLVAKILRGTVKEPITLEHKPLSSRSSKTAYRLFPHCSPFHWAWLEVSALRNFGIVG